MISPNVILPLDDTHANIPEGWTRVTELDGKYPKGTASGVNPNVTGGSATHSHTSSNHTHTMAGHSHSVTTSNNNHPEPTTNNSTSGSGSPRNTARNSHNHSGTISTLASTSISNVAVTYSAFSNDPPFYTVIFIKQNGYVPIPANALVLKEGTTRDGMDFHTASANRYLKGANTNANAGGTGGSTTNSHTITHTHTTSHGHTGATGAPSGGESLRTGSGASVNAVNHSHNITLNVTNVTSGNNSAVGDQAETVEPAYRKLNAFKASTNTMPMSGDIALWLGSLDSIPIGWAICDGANGTPDMRDRFLKINTSATTSSIGGSNTHTHANQAHTHTVGSHSHGGSVAVAPDNQTGYSGGAKAWKSNGGSHSLSSVSSVATTLESANTSADSANNEPEYRTVAYIQFLFMANVASPILNLMVDQIENWN